MTVLRSIDLSRGTRRFQRFGGGAAPGAPAPGPSGPRGILDPQLLRAALPEAVRKLDPRLLFRSPVMFIVEITAALVTIVLMADLLGLQPTGPGGLGFELQIAGWLWFTVLFATYAEAVAEARGRAQAATLRKARSVTTRIRRRADGTIEQVGSCELRRDDIVEVSEGQTIPGDGDVIEGIGFVNESAITGESAPVLKEPGTDIRSSVTGGTTLVSDQLVIRITADPGETFLDRMIALVEGAKRARTPNEIALAILLAGLTLVFLLAVVTLRAFGQYADVPVDTVALVALLVCLIPTTIGGLLSAIGIAGMDRVARFNVLAMSGRAVEASGDVDVILLDKTGTITFGNRLAASITPATGVTDVEVLTAALLSSVHDETPEGRSIVELARTRLAALGAAAGTGDDAGLTALAATVARGHPVPGRDADQRRPHHGRPHRAQGRQRRHRRSAHGAASQAASAARIDELADQGATPLVLRVDDRPLGVIELKDTVK